MISSESTRTIKAARGAKRARGSTFAAEAALPYVLINMSMTADGKIATANRDVSTFGSRTDQDHLLELRTTVDAVMAGARTVDQAPVDLGPGEETHRRKRREAGLAENNLRVVVSGSGTLRPEAEIFKHRFSPIVILTTERISRRHLTVLQSVADTVRVGGCNEIDFAGSLRWLRAEWGVRRLLCEGGGELNVALLRADLVDEIHVTICPYLFGGQGSPTLAEGWDAHRLAEAMPYACHQVRQEGEELFVIYRRKRSAARTIGST